MGARELDCSSDQITTRFKEAQRTLVPNNLKSQYP